MSLLQRFIVFMPLMPMILDFKVFGPIDFLSLIISYIHSVGTLQCLGTVRHVHIQTSAHFNEELFFLVPGTQTVGSVPEQHSSEESAPTRPGRAEP